MPRGGWLTILACERTTRRISEQGRLLANRQCHASDAASFELLDGTQLQTLCDTTCQSELSVLREAIAGACTASQDVMVPNGFAYPGGLLLLCPVVLQDSSIGQVPN